MTFAEVRIGQTIIRANLAKPPLFGRVVGKDAVGTTKVGPLILLRTTSGDVAVPVSELAEWKALHA